MASKSPDKSSPPETSDSSITALEVSEMLVQPQAAVAVFPWLPPGPSKQLVFPTS